MLTENNIMQIDSPEKLLNQDLLYDWLEEQPEDRERLAAFLMIKAKEFGVQKEIQSVLRAYAKAEKKLAEQYNRDFARENAEIQIDFDGHGKPLVTVDNFLQILKYDEKFRGLKYNLLTYSPEQERDGVTYRWTDADDAEMRRYVEKKYKLHSAQKSDDALRIVLSENQYHPIRDYIDSLQWDGVSRIKDFLIKWTMCENSEYAREVSRLIFAGGIHRLYNPGCKFDDMPVLIGTKQGEGKSTLIRWLALKDDYFTEVNEFEGQRGIESIEGAWICEVSELLALTKVKEQEAVKSYLTRLNDRYRMPFDKRVTDHPRQCVFIGTTNKEQFLTDKTGNRRFLPIKVHQSGYNLFDHEQDIKDDIRQCWAEALCLFKAGQLKPYADRRLVATIRQKQEDATEDDYRVGMIEDYIKDKREVCILELWKKALDMGDFSKPTKKDSNEIGLILQSLGTFERQDTPKNYPPYGKQRWWKRVSSENFSDEEEIQLPW